MTFGITTFGCDAGRSGIGRYATQLIRELPLLTDTPDRFEILVHRNERDAFIPADTSARVHVLPGRLIHPIPDIAWHQTALPAFCALRRYDALFLPAGNRRLPVWSPCPTVGTVHDFSALHVAGKYDAARVFYIRKVLPALMRRLTHVRRSASAAARTSWSTAGFRRTASPSPRWPWIRRCSTRATGPSRRTCWPANAA